MIGASIGGLLAARALSETCAEVVLLDRDRLPAGPAARGGVPVGYAARRGVPQGRQLHVLLARGRQVLEELFPGLGAELSRRGAPAVDLHGEVHWYNDGHRMRRAPSTLHAFGMSRPLLEDAVRERVAALAGVRIVTEVEVTGLTATDDHRRVTGVRTRLGDGAVGTLAADLVVDTGGRGSRSPLWLTELGYRPAAEERVDVGVTYVTRSYRREPGQLDGLLGALANAMPGQPRGGIVAPQEGDRFAVALSGMLGEQPPTDDRGMAAFAAALPAPQIAELLRTATPAGEPARMRFPASVRRRYERLRRFPAGYLVMGDALCSFNPVYGQGMTVAALEAHLLGTLLRRGDDRLARRFFRRAARVIDGPWSISVGTDLRFPGVTGRRTPAVRFVNAYVNRLHAAATADPALGAAFLRVLNLIDPPARLLAPGVALRVLRGARPAPTVAPAGTADGQRPSASSMAR
ncbi:2-polyprenyl-6-methoxyphenol hydroxylase [Micromonospora chaiyaphumensis]|uniref:2-polyprenyl-6-methoxyphenol hydroxylase n=1 Tax=Micromonospora chaiyaphumensis TaxID=307119 RepID=A0A1C4X6R9_9ACTN|nr:2-polyprenyl-6-methoxyphenol hydroxylase [Micromonospora chaiyaphumensis]